MEKSKNEINKGRYKMHFEFIKYNEDILKIRTCKFRRKLLQKYLLFLNLIYQVLLKYDLQKDFLFNSYEITLKVNGTGIKQILGSNYSCPYQIYLNNQIQNLNPCYRINIDTEGSNIKLVWNSIDATTKYMFNDCSNIIEINLTKFDTSSVTIMSRMFSNCISLISLDISNLNTNNVQSMDYLFYKCNKLTSINLNSFNTAKVKTFRSMFENCYSLESIDLSNFDTSSTEILWDMFKNCKSLISINLSNFDTSRVTDFEGLFNNCTKLEYINLNYFIDNKQQYIINAFNYVPKNLVICIDSTKSPSLYNLTKQISCVTFSCIYNWKNVQKKIIHDTGVCTNNCQLTNYKIEYKSKCYSSCPDGTYYYDNSCYPCDINCKTCNINLNLMIGANCTSCYDNKFLNKGICVDNCINGFYEDEANSNIKICKCEEEKKCKQCSLDSLSHNNLCISCNDNYYPKLNDTNNYENYINCYSGSIDNYYFDNSDKYYKKFVIKMEMIKYIIV